MQEVISIEDKTKQVQGTLEIWICCVIKYFFSFYLYLAALSSVPRCESCVVFTGPSISN